MSYRYCLCLHVSKVTLFYFFFLQVCMFWLPCLLAIFSDMQHLEPCLITVLLWYCLKSGFHYYPFILKSFSYEFLSLLCILSFLPSLNSLLIYVFRMLLEEFLGWWVPCLLRLSFSLLEVPMQMSTKQESPIKNRDHRFPHPVSRKTSRHDQVCRFFSYTFCTNAEIYSLIHWNCKHCYQL